MMIRTYMACTLLFAVRCAFAASIGAYSFPPDKGPLLVQQCSRDSPRDAKDFFKPTPSQIVELEERLGPYLDGVRPDIHFQDYNRQYVGFMKSGVRYIYGNFFKPEPGDWSLALEPVIICDGGDVAWGVVYSLESKAFQDLHFNGVG